MVWYTLQDAPADEVTLSILDAAGHVIKTFSGPSKANEADKQDADKVHLSVQPGLNRFVWDMRYPDATRLPGELMTKKSVTGPLAVPGAYQAQLKVDGQTYTQSFELRPDPRVNATPEDLQAQFDLWAKIRDKLAETHEAVSKLRRIKEQVSAWLQNLDAAGDFETVTEAGQALAQKLSAIESELVSTEAKYDAERLALKAKLNLKLATLISIVSSADAAPPRQAYDVFEHLSTQVDEQLAQLKVILEQDVVAFNQILKNRDVPGVVV